MTNMNAMELTNYASQQSDRWLFIAVLVILGVVATIVARYFVKQHDGLIADHKEARAKHEAALTTIVDRHADNNLKMVVSLDRNTQVIAENTVELRRCREERARA